MQDINTSISFASSNLDIILQWNKQIQESKFLRLKKCTISWSTGNLPSNLQYTVNTLKVSEFNQLHFIWVWIRPTWTCTKTFSEGTHVGWVWENGTQAPGLVLRVVVLSNSIPTVLKNSKIQFWYYSLWFSKKWKLIPLSLSFIKLLFFHSSLKVLR